MSENNYIDKTLLDDSKIEIPIRGNSTENNTVKFDLNRKHSNSSDTESENVFPFNNNFTKVSNPLLSRMKRQESSVPTGGLSISKIKENGDLIEHASVRTLIFSLFACNLYFYSLFFSF